MPPARFVRRRQPGIDLVVGFRAAAACEGEAVADLDALHRLDAHQRRRETRVEAGCLLRVGAEPGQDAGRHHLDDPAERVTVLPRGVGGIAHAGICRLAADLDGTALHPDPELAQQRLCDGPRGDVHGRVPRGRPLERVADVGVVELEDACEVCVSRAGQRDGLRPLPRRLALGRPRAHAPRPVRVVAIPDDERQRRPERQAMPKAGQHLHLVRLELLPRAAPVALLTPPQVGVDGVLLQAQARGHAGHDRRERGPVRLPCRDDVERHGAILEAPSYNL